jgi:hypothetical protein
MKVKLQLIIINGEVAFNGFAIVLGRAGGLLWVLLKRWGLWVGADTGK